MRKLMLLAGAAALGLSMPALAKDQGRGGGRGHGGQAAHAQQGGQGGHARAERGRGHGGQARAERRGGDQRAARGNGNRGDVRMSGHERRVERAIQQERRATRNARRDDRSFQRLDRDVRHARVDHRDWRGWSDRRVAFNDRSDTDDFIRFHGDRGRRLAVGPGGCPPGLARQNDYCMPPGQLRKAGLIGQRVPFASYGYNIPERYRYRFVDDGRFFYRYDNDWTVYRFDRTSGLVSSVIPLYSSGLLLGEPMPLGYDVYNVPFAYRGYYRDSDDWLYRYDNNAIYRVNAETMLVDSIAQLLVGGPSALGGLGVGDRLPVGYDAYNVPFAYRDRYYDTDDRMYRYADNSIYQIDPETMLIASVISLLT